MRNKRRPAADMAMVPELSLISYASTSSSATAVNSRAAAPKARPATMGAAGTGVAIETADIALMRDDLLKLPQAVGLARRTVGVMRQNIAIALLTVVVLPVGVFAGGVTMAIGMLVHEASVLLVIANAMRLLRRRDDGRTPVLPARPREPQVASASQQA